MKEPKLPTFCVISDAIGPQHFLNFVNLTHHTPARELPKVADLDADYIFVFGPLKDGPVAASLGGIVLLARQAGATVVFAYHHHLAIGDINFLGRMGAPSSTGSTPRVVTIIDETFRRYFTQFGISGTSWSKYELEEAETLATTGYDDPAAWREARTGARGGPLYVVPYHLPTQADPRELFGTLATAVQRHDKAIPDGLPSFLTDLRLGDREARVINEIEDLSERLNAALKSAREYEQWRHLLGTTTGTPLLNLIADALNVILEGTDHRAELRKDVGEEDFWIVGPEGDVALGEAKGVGGGVGREEVSKVDVHRSAVGRDETLPGLLVMNVFRNADDLERRTTAEVAPNVVKLAKVQNVLVVQTFELYQLLGAALEGRDVGSALLESLQAGGGWLRMTDGVPRVE